jgi:lipopolysaccharide biosynthesis glycosyltransferase
MLTENEINIVLGSDKNNALGLAVTIKSILNTTSRYCNFFILDMGISKNDKMLIQKSFEGLKIKKLEFFYVPLKELSGMRPTMYLKSGSCYSRLLLDKKLSKDINRCLWLDTDLIVNSDICELYDMNIDDYTIGAICDISTKNLNGDLIKHYLHDLKLENPFKYFNSGVLLINLKKWKEQNIGEAAINYARTNYHFLDAQDQDVLNAILKDKWLNLDEKWNQSQYLSHLNEKEGIIHLIGQKKPWHADYEYKFKDRFFEILDSTYFKGRRPLDLWGLGKFLKKLERATPTLEIVCGKIHRLLRNKR